MLQNIQCNELLSHRQKDCIEFNFLILTNENNNRENYSFIIAVCQYIDSLEIINKHTLNDCMIKISLERNIFIKISNAISEKSKKLI